MWCLGTLSFFSLRNYGVGMLQDRLLLFMHLMWGFLKSSHKGWAQAALVIMAFFGVEVTSDIPFEPSKKKSDVISICSFTFVVSFLICLFFGWMRMVKVEEMEQKRKGKRKYMCVFVILLMIGLFDLKEKVVCWSWRWWCCEREKKNLFCWLIQTECDFFIWWS